MYKKKGTESDCNNHKGVSLLSIADKGFACVIFPRLQKLTESVYPELQCRFRSQLYTTDMIFYVRQLQEKCKYQNVLFYIVLIDLTKAFVLVSREGLFAILFMTGYPQSLFKIMKCIHTNMKATVQYGGDVSDSFTIKSGVKQGRILAPTLFGIFFAMLLKRAFCSSTIGVKLHTRSDEHLSNPARLKAKRKIKKEYCTRSALC